VTQGEGLDKGQSEDIDGNGPTVRTTADRYTFCLLGLPGNAHIHSRRSTVSVLHVLVHSGSDFAVRIRRLILCETDKRNEKPGKDRGRDVGMASRYDS
jgi:hypothetical protein